MPVADASLTSLRDSDLSEATYGVPSPGASNMYKTRRLVSETLGQDKEVVQSDEVVSDRRSPSNIQVGSSASGALVAELTGGGAVPAEDTWDFYWRSSIGANNYSTLATLTFTGAGSLTPANGADPDEITLLIGASVTPATWTATLGTLVVGEFVLLTGFTGVRSILNAIYKIKSGLGTATITLSSGPRVPASPGTEPAVNVQAFQIPSLTDGSVFRSITMERAYTNLSGQFALLSGMVLAGFDIEMRPKTPVRVTWNFIGKDEVSTTVTQPTGGTVAAVSIVSSFSPVTDLRMFALNENGNDYFVNSFRLSLRNGAYPQDERAGNLGAVGVGLGTFDITGSYEFYYDNTAGTSTAGRVHDALRSFTDQELAFGLSTALAHTWYIHLPRINWTGGRRQAAGKDQAILGRVDFRAAEGPAYMVKLGRL